MLYALLGLIVGLTIGVTGVGGTTLMTPLLLIAGVTPTMAVGSGLIFSLLTKIVASIFYGQRQRIHWRLVAMLCLGSIPASILTTFFLKHFEGVLENNFITISIGIIVVITSSFLLWQQLEITNNNEPKDMTLTRWQCIAAVIFAFVIGVIVTLTSLGAGVMTLVFLFWFFNNLSARTIISVNLLHAIILTLIASIGHIVLLHVNFQLIGWLLFGSLPGVYIGYLFSRFISERMMRRLIAVILFAIGVIILIRV